MSYSEGTNRETEFSGQKKVLRVDVSPDSASGNITIGEYDNVEVIGLLFIEALASTCLGAYALENSTTANQVDIVLYNASGAAASTFPDFRLTLIVWDTAD